MYPELTPPLLAGLLGAAGGVGFLVAFRPVLRRLALRQVVRRPTESLLVVLGSVLGTALIVASLTVGDSLDRSVRQAAYDTLGPIDVSVRSPSAELGDEVARRLAPLAADPDLDGMITARVDPAAAVAAGGQLAEPRTLAWEMDYAAAAEFGAPHPSGLAVAAPGAGEVVINEHLAASLGVGAGDRVTFYLFQRPVQATVAQVVPAEGLAGAGLGATTNHNAFFPAGTLTSLAEDSGTGDLTTITYLSNRGGVEGGVGLTDQVVDRVEARLRAEASASTAVETPKRDVLDEAEATGATLGAVFLLVGSFSIFAGVLLITNIFVMLAEERKGQLGTLRAIGLRRRRVTAGLAIEGAVYSGAAVMLGGAVGVLLGRVVAVLAGRIFNTWEQSDNQLEITFAVTPTSVFNGMAAGFLIAFLAVVLTSIRVSRMNIIAAIRDLEQPPQRRHRLVVASAVVTAGLAALSVPVVVRGVGYLTYLVPALAVVAAVPMLRRFFRARAVYTGVALAVLGWGLLASLVRRSIFDDASTATYVVLGSLVTFGAVVLISQQQSVLLRPLRWLVNRPTQGGLATRLAIAYPTAKPFQTGATLAMYCIVVFVIVMLTQISAIIDAGVGRSVNEATGGWSLRADFLASGPPAGPEQALTSGRMEGQAVAATGLTTAPVVGDDPKGRTSEPLPVLAIGFDDPLTEHAPALQHRLPGLADDAAAWQLVLDDSSYVLIDSIYGSPGGPPGEPVMPGQVITLTDPRSGERVERTVAGVIGSGQAFYGIGGGEMRYPVLMSQSALRALSGTGAGPASTLLRLDPDADPAQVAAALEAAYLTSGLVVTDIAQSVRDDFAGTRQFFLLMQGYLALGLLVGITSLGVVMVRAVRERRRTIAVLRALGFRARTVRRAFLTESMFVALQGVAVGTVLAIATTWLFYQHNPSLETLRVGYPVAWLAIGLTVGGTLLASLLATLGPARRAAGIRPAVALRIAD